MARSSVRALSTVAALATVLLGLTATREAKAWCRTTTEEDFEPTPDQPCSVTGTPAVLVARDA